jgi:hypothetical protein
MRLSRPATFRLLCAAGAVFALELACSKHGTDYGTLACLDAWPSPPSPAGSTQSLAVTPSILWQTSLGSSAVPQSAGVALWNENVVASAGASWIALDRRTGKVLLNGRGDAPANYFLGAPAVDRQGVIYVQSNVTMDAFDPDGSRRWSVGLPGEGTTSEPLQGMFAPTILDDTFVVAGSRAGEVAFTVSADSAWTPPLGTHIKIGHWGVGYDQTAGYVIDLRTGKAAGRLRSDNGHDVIPLRALAGRGIVAWDRDNSTALRLLLLDTCGKEVWSLSIPGMKVCTAGGVTGPGDVMYLNIGSCSGGEPSPSIIGVSPDGHIVSGPVPSSQLAWLVGADGTLYVVDIRSSTATSRLVALSPSLETLWTLEIDGSFNAGAHAIMSDDGILYAQVSQNQGNTVVAIQTTSPGPAESSWPMLRHDSRSSNWAGDTF